MFIITVHDSKLKHYESDIKTAGDVIVGLTNKDGEYNRVISIMGNMKFWDIFVADGYSITCVPEEAGD